jgi:hypothetical protein
MYYVFASLVIGAFIGSSALMSHPTASYSAESTVETARDVEATAEVQDRGPIIDNQALSAEASLSLSF